MSSEDLKDSFDEPRGAVIGAVTEQVSTLDGREGTATGYSFASVRVDGMTYDHDLVIDRGKVRSARRPPPGSSAAGTGTPRSLPRRTSRGDAAGW